jgi:hypothetical protein
MSASDARHPGRQGSGRVVVMITGATCRGVPGATGATPTETAPSCLSVIRLIDATPALLAAHLRYIHDHDEEITGVLARREGAGPVTDRRPQVLAAIVGGLVFLADRDWRAEDGQDLEAMIAAFDAYADVLGPALSGH